MSYLRNITLHKLFIKKDMKTKPNILLLLIIGFISLTSCSSSDSSSGNTNPINSVRIKTLTTQQLIGGVWKNTYKTTNTFEGNNLMMSASLTQKWNTTISQWENSSQSIYTLYDSAHASQQIIQNWDITTASWTNQNRHTFTDDTAGNRLKTETESWTSGNWELTQKGDFIYDGNNYLIRTETSSWNVATSSWSNPLNKTVYTNNAQGKPILAETYIGSDTTPYSKETLTYDANGYLLTRFGQFISMGNWINSYLIEQTNLQNGFANLINQTNYDLNGNISTQFRYVYEYY